MDIKNIKDKRIVAIYVVVVLLLVLGLTYALVTSDILFNLTTGTVAIDDTAYGETTFDNSNLDMVPILDSEVESKTDNVIKIDFKVGGNSTNNNQNIIYDIALNDLKVNCKLLSPYVKWKLVKNGTSISNGSLDYKFDTIDKYGRLVLTDIQQDLPDYSSSQTGYDSYTFYMWLSDSCQNSDIGKCTSSTDQSSLMGQSISGKVEVELYTEGKKKLTRNPSSSASDSTCSGDRYLVHYNSNGGTIVKGENKYVVSGSTISDLPTPTKSHTVIFNTNGGSNVVNVGYDINRLDDFTLNSIPKLKMLADENKKVINYTFDGWYLDDNFSTKVTSDTVIDTDKTLELYAKWSGDGNITLPSTTKSGYKFFGWYSDSNYNIKIGDAGSKYLVSSDINLYGKWGKNSTVTYRVVNNLMSSSQYTSSNKISLTGTSNDTYQYYSDVTVYLEAGKQYFAYGESDGTWTDTHPTGGSSTAVGFWVYNQENGYHHVIPVNTGSFTVNYTGLYELRLNVYQSGVTHQFWNFGVRPLDTTASVTEGEKYPSFPNVTLPGYTFAGWYTGSITGDKVTTDTTVTSTSDHMLYARWTPSSVNVTYDTNENIFSAMSTNTSNTVNGVTYSYDGTYLTLNGTLSASLNLFHFLNSFATNQKIVTTLTYVSGSYTENGSSNRFVIDVENSSFASLSPRNNINVVLPTSSNTVSSQTLSVNSDAVTNGKYLKVWFWTSSASTLTFSNYKIEVDIREVKTYASSSYTIGNEYIPLGTASTRTGFTFDGWYTDPYSGFATTSKSIVNNPKAHSLYAHWSRNSYTVTIGRNNTSYGTVSTSSISVPYGTNYTVNGNQLIFSNGTTVTASVTNQTGYTTTLSGWSSTVGVVTGNTTITANFSRSINYYTVTISRNNSNYGTVSATSVKVPHGTTYTSSGATLTFSNGSKVTATAAATSNGVVKSFSSWSSGSGTITEDKTITANFTTQVAQVCLKMDMNGGKLNSKHGSQIGSSGTSIIRTDYSGDARYCIHYYPYGKTGINLPNVHNENFINLTRRGYSIVSGKQWCKTKTGTNCFSSSGTVAASSLCDASKGSCSVILYANWKKN